MQALAGTQHAVWGASALGGDICKRLEAGKKAVEKGPLRGKEYAGTMFPARELNEWRAARGTGRAEC